jgi:putative hydrolase of the HAD superfamily
VVARPGSDWGSCCKDLRGRDVHPPSVVLFDLGGVLVEWDGIDPLVRLCQGRLDREGARRFWLESPSVRRFETGQIGRVAFAAGVVRELGLDLPLEAFLEAFVSWDRGFLPGAIDLLRELSGRCILACLTNNNELHWNKLHREPAFDRLFSRVYSSHQTGRMKPDVEAFEYAVADLDVRPEDVLFLDDNHECVSAARALRLRARQVRGVGEARRALVEEGVIDE